MPNLRNFSRCALAHRQVHTPEPLVAALGSFLTRWSGPEQNVRKGLAALACHNVFTYAARRRWGRMDAGGGVHATSLQRVGPHFRGD
jgi:hypothetical protein